MNDIEKVSFKYTGQSDGYKKWKELETQRSAKWNDCDLDGFPPLNGYFLLQGECWIELPDKYTFEGHKMNLEVTFHDLQWFGLSKCEVLENKIYLSKATVIHFESICCTSDEDQKKHKSFLYAIENFDIDKIIKSSKYYYNYLDITKWIYLEDAPRLDRE